MLHNSNIRPSLHRLAVLSFVANRRSHPRAEDIFNELTKTYPAMSRTTVYNSLHTLAEAGLLRELEIESGNKRYDLGPQTPHSHFVCRRCGKIFDMKLPESVRDIAMNDFVVDSVDVYIKGLCPACVETN
ncbi:MAG: transcriptional repressor [Muribaculaceae bacterium]|nr:transcriptional repressor [Muribaculaceae bacterium]